MFANTIDVKIMSPNEIRVSFRVNELRVDEYHLKINEMFRLLAFSLYPTQEWTDLSTDRAEARICSNNKYMIFRVRVSDIKRDVYRIPFQEFASGMAQLFARKKDWESANGMSIEKALAQQATSDSDQARQDAADAMDRVDEVAQQQDQQDQGAEDQQQDSPPSDEGIGQSSEYEMALARAQDLRSAANDAMAAWEKASDAESDAKSVWLENQDDHDLTAALDKARANNSEAQAIWYELDIQATAAEVEAAALLGDSGKG